MKRLLITSLMLAATLACFTACTAPMAQSGGSRLVEQAYNSPNMLHVKPYTRTIFSSTDF